MLISMSNLLPHPFQEHPHYPDYCAYSVGEEDYCKRGADHAIHAEFRTTKEAMEYAHKHQLPAVVPVSQCPPHKLEKSHYYLLTDSPKAGKTVGQCLRKVRICKICKGVFAE